jgi:cytidine deaminase
MKSLIDKVFHKQAHNINYSAHKRRIEMKLWKVILIISVLVALFVPLMSAYASPCSECKKNQQFLDEHKDRKDRLLGEIGWAKDIIRYTDEEIQEYQHEINKLRGRVTRYICINTYTGETFTSKTNDLQKLPLGTKVMGQTHSHKAKMTPGLKKQIRDLEKKIDALQNKIADNEDIIRQKTLELKAEERLIAYYEEELKKCLRKSCKPPMKQQQQQQEYIPGTNNNVASPIYNITPLSLKPDMNNLNPVFDNYIADIRQTRQNFDQNRISYNNSYHSTYNDNNFNTDPANNDEINNTVNRIKTLSALTRKQDNCTPCNNCNQINKCNEQKQISTTPQPCKTKITQPLQKKTTQPVTNNTFIDPIQPIAPVEAIPPSYQVNMPITPCHSLQ